MELPEQNAESQDAFQRWLTQPTGDAFEYKDGQYHITVIRVRRNMDFDYLYCQRQYRGTGIERGDRFEYAGVFCKRDGLVYDRQYDIRELIEPDERSAEALRLALTQTVREAVDAAINNDRNNLRVSEISSERERENFAYFQKHTAPGKAREAYLSGAYDDGDTFAPVFHCDYTPDKWTEYSLLAYILDPAQYVTAEATAFIDGNQEDMLLDFMQADAIAAEYAAILANPMNPVHRVKRIMQAVNASPAKTVTVTICKDDIDFTFKVEAGQLRRDCYGIYNDWYIVAADRRKFKKLFGNSASYKPEDILRIEYSRSVLYQAEEAME